MLKPLGAGGTGINYNFFKVNPSILDPIFAVNTGQDVDFLNKQIYINKGRVNGVQQETTKTNKARFVDLNDFAFEAFQQLRLLTYLKYEHVFICDETGKEYTTQKSLSEKFVTSLKANGIS